MKKPKKVQAPEGCDPHLTAGKIYDVTGFYIQEPSEENGYAFNIIDDLGRKVYTLERGSAHLNCGNWIVIETE
jgi:hypothetical protein